jgi:hypothetical protein
VKVEHCALQEWAMREWDGLQRAHTHASGFLSHLTNIPC